jgi:hypothetical protein
MCGWIGFTAGCQGGPPGGGVAGGEDPAPSVDTGAEDSAVPDTGNSALPVGDPPTYTEDIQPLVERSCQGCHQDEGIGPFPLTTYTETFESGPWMREEIEARTMPPWFAEKSCGEYDNDTSLTDDEIAMFGRWVDGGMIEGPPVADTGSDIVVETLDRVDVELQLPEPYEPQTEMDAVRCFNVEWPLKKHQYITALQIKPGNFDILHHVTIHLVEPERVPAVIDQDAADPEMGYPCTENGTENASDVIGGWLGGPSVYEFPEGSGVKVLPGSIIQVQAHYTVSSAQAGRVADQTGVEFTIEHNRLEAYLALVTPPELIGSAEPLLPAGDPSVTHSSDFTPAGLPESFTIHAVNFHMHQLGIDGGIWVKHPDGTEDCVLELTGWNFDWQENYSLVNPVPFSLAAGDVLRLECTWDNSQENQPQEDGIQRPAADIYWSETLDGEMCMASLRVVEVETEGADTGEAEGGDP